MSVFLEDLVAHQLALVVLLLVFDQHQRVDYNLVDCDYFLLDLGQFSLVLMSLLLLSGNDIAQRRDSVGLWRMRCQGFG